VKRNPPEALLGQISWKPTNEIVKRYLVHRLLGVFPNAKALIDDTRLDVAFKGVTYEMLQDAAFQQAVKDGFPYEHGELSEEFEATPSCNRSFLANCCRMALRDATKCGRLVQQPYCARGVQWLRLFQPGETSP
jgi:hypothetical protein